jgi:hypothetical protein
MSEIQKTPAQWIQFVTNIVIYVVGFAIAVVSTLGFTGVIPDFITGLPAIITAISGAAVVAASGIYDAFKGKTE